MKSYVVDEKYKTLMKMITIYFGYQLTHGDLLEVFMLYLERLLLSNTSHQKVLSINRVDEYYTYRKF